MISLTWFDLLAVGILIFFTMRGAVKGVVFQLASLAGIVLCFVFSNAISQAAGPYVHLEPPLNYWVILAVSYLGFTFLCYMVARTMSDWLERNKLKDFDRHLGAVFGFVKGIALILVLTFFLVTMSQSAREALKGSYTGKYAALLMDNLHPVMPARLHAAVEEYIHLLDHDGLDLKAHDHGYVAPSLGSSSPLGAPGAFPSLPNSSQPGSLFQPINSGSTPPPLSPNTSGSLTSNLWGQIQGAFSSESQRVINDAMKNSDPATRQQMEQGLQSLMNSVPEKDRAELQRQITQVGANQLKQYLDSKLSGLGAPVSTPTTPSPFGTSIPSTPSPFGTSIPSTPSPFGTSIPQTPTQQQPTGSQLQTRKAQMSQEIAGIYTPDAVYRQNIERDIAQRTAGIPDNVVVAALTDWLADLKKTADPDPQTNSSHPIEVRLLRQLQAAGLRLEQMSFEVQQRLRAGQAQSPGGASGQL